ncbi:MAG: sortase-associated OmpA-like protein PdsO [Alteromonadaceae bacterium]|nr:sortase-associated OmpA-like protein PdsO [Alteromonadaceae bacterium]
MNTIKMNTQKKLISLILISSFASGSVIAEPMSEKMSNTKVNHTKVNNTMVNNTMVNNTTTAEDKAETADTREEIGFGAGALVGGLLGGPAGAFVGGLAGNFIANYVNATEEIEDLAFFLDEEKSMHKQNLAQNEQWLNHKLNQAEQAYQTELLALQQSYQTTGQLQAENLLMSLQFSTGSSELADHYDEQIYALANLLKRASSLSIDLSGYTDLQGGEDLNQKLSLARVSSVKKALVEHGIAEQRIAIFAYGEKQPVVASIHKEVSFYDRRVVVKLHKDSGQVAKN